MNIRDIIAENQPGVAEGTNEFSRNIEAFRVYQHLDPMEFYNFASTPRGLQILAQKAGTTPESVKDSLERMDWGQFPADFYQDPEDDEQDVSEAKARYEMTDPDPGTAPRGRGRPPGIKHPIGYIDNRDDGQPRIGRVEKTATGIKHLARPERGGVEPTADPLATLDKSTTNRLDRAFGVKWPKEKKMQGSIDLTALDSNQPGVAEGRQLYNDKQRRNQMSTELMRSYLDLLNEKQQNITEGNAAKMARVAKRCARQAFKDTDRPDSKMFLKAAEYFAAGDEQRGLDTIERMDTEARDDFYMGCEDAGIPIPPPEPGFLDSLPKLELTPAQEKKRKAMLKAMGLPLDEDQTK